MSSLIGNVPDIIDSLQSQFSFGFVVIYFFGQDGVRHFEAIGFEWRSGVIIIIGDNEVGGELCPNFFIVGAGLGLE